MELDESESKSEPRSKAIALGFDLDLDLGLGLDLDFFDFFDWGRERGPDSPGVGEVLDCLG